jgi:SAM-dependent methyltransferase
VPQLSSPSQAGGLTTPEFWDERWSDVTLPVEVQRSRYLSIDAILDVFDRFLSHDPELSVLELGGAPGQWLVYLHRTFGCRIGVLDNSPVGAVKARENFALLGIPADVLEQDLFAPPPEPHAYDVVYSLGVIEHFDDSRRVVEAHLRFLRPGGLLVVGCPNLRGVNRFVLARLAPSYLALHNTDSMELEKWRGFEEALGLEPLYKGYVGGFDPGILTRVEGQRLSRRAAAGSLSLLGAVLNRRGLRFLRRANSPAWSSYAIAVYRARGGAA